ncbi:MAG: hypothetical protein ABI591_28495 [Kofleriaceae bacterium]
MKLARLALLAGAACSQPAAVIPPRPPPPQQLALYDLVGDWRWLYRTDERNTSRVEDERWRLRTDPKAPSQLVGRYLRSVDVSALDHTVFQCNERPTYRQTTVYDVVAQLIGNELVIKETDYQTEPSPCDHGFRHLGEYHAKLAAGHLALHWGHGTESGVQTLWHVGEAKLPLPEVPWPSSYVPTGTWRWNATSLDATGNVHDETEWWEITRRSDTQLDATYRRRVTVRSPDGTTVIPCAGKPSWTYDDAYVLDGQKEEDHWHFHELAVEPGDHPCLRVTPKRTLDEATAEQIGDYFVLEWRGKRHEILYRPPSRPSSAGP